MLRPLSLARADAGTGLSCAPTEAALKSTRVHFAVRPPSEEGEMPFTQQTARQFTRSDIESLRAGQNGVYGLFKPNTWVYVGKGDIRDRLLAHLNGDNPCITGQRPTSWVGEVTNSADNRERQLIVELNPVCNKQVG